MLRSALASSILTVVVLCDRFWLTRDNSLLHISLIGVFRLFPSSFQGRKCCSVSEITSLRQHSNMHLRWDLVLLFAARSVYLTVKLSALGTSSRLAVHWAAVAGFAVRSVVARSRQCVYSFHFDVSLCQHTSLFLGQLPHLLLQSVMRGTDLRHALICIGELMSQRITVSGHCCQLLCHAGKLRFCFWHCSN